MKKFFATAVCCVAFAGLTGGCESDGSSELNVAPGAVSESCCGSDACAAEACDAAAEAVAPGAVSGKSGCCASSCDGEKAVEVVAPGAVSGKADCGAGSCDSAAAACPFSGGDA